MNRRFILPLAGSLILLGSIPVMAAGHGHASVAHSAPSHTVTLPTQAASQTRAALQAHLSTGSPAHLRATTHLSGQPTQIKADIAEIHTLRAEIQTARTQYVAAVQAYVKALSATLSTGQSTGLSTALNQLHTINVTLAQAVKTEISANAAASSTGTTPAKSTGLVQVIAKFKAELTALQAATAQVQVLTAQLGSAQNAQ